MASALIIAKTFGPFLAIVGLWMLLFGDNVAKIMTAIKNSPGAQYASALLLLLIGLFLINSYNVWMANMLIFVTLLGWVAFIRGVLGLYMPQLMVSVFLSNRKWNRFFGIIPRVWGLILIWLGFYML
jgi:hypothetical protein